MRFSRTRVATAATAVIVIASAVAPVSSALAAKRPADKAAVPAPARDAQYTIYCQTIGGPAHVEQAKAVKDKLVASAPDTLKDWYVIHQDNQSVLYYGHYRTISAPADAKDKAGKKESDGAQRDRQAIAGMMDRSGARIFNHVYFVPISAPDPDAPPAWNLVNANGYYTLQIAAYKDDPRRKEAAVQAVREARERGLEAYYYHGETTSSVCIGTWPKSAISEPTDQDPEKGIVPSSSDPNETMLVLPEQTSDLDQLKVRDARDGQRIRTYAPDRKIVDPTLIMMKEKYPTHAVNGVVYVTRQTDPATNQTREVEDQSFIVPIPRPKSSLLTAQPAPELLGGGTGATGVGQSTSTPDGGGRLKSLGDR